MDTNQVAVPADSAGTGAPAITNHDLMDQGKDQLLRWIPEEVFDERAIDPYSVVETLFQVWTQQART